MHDDRRSLCRYQGCAALRRVVVAGAAGGIGEGVVRALLSRDGVEVVAVSRAQERLDALRAHLGELLAARCTSLVGDAADFTGALAVAQRIEELGGCDAAVAILGRGFWTGAPLLDTSPEEWAAILGEMLTSHFAFARAMIPRLAARADSLYLSIGGGAAFTPARDAGLMSIAAAGQAMLTRVLAREGRGRQPRIAELVVEGFVRTRASRDSADPRWLTDDEVGAAVADLATDGVLRWRHARIEGPLIIMHPRR